MSTINLEDVRMFFIDFGNMFFPYYFFFPNELRTNERKIALYHEKNKMLELSLDIEREKILPINLDIENMLFPINLGSDIEKIIMVIKNEMEDADRIKNSLINFGLAGIYLDDIVNLFININIFDRSIEITGVKSFTRWYNYAQYNHITNHVTTDVLFYETYYKIYFKYITEEQIYSYKLTLNKLEQMRHNPIFIHPKSQHI